MRKIEKGKKYRHFKGHQYQVLEIATDSETLEKMVVYQELDHKHQVWVRSYKMFNSFVDKEKYSKISQTYRFEEIEEIQSVTKL